MDYRYNNLFFRSFLTLGLLSVIISTDASFGTVCGGGRVEEGQICCKAQLHNTTNEYGRALSCCNDHHGIGLYDKMEKICCGRQLVDIQDENKNERRCCRQRGGPSPHDEIFTPENNQFCCDGIVREANERDSHTCCGKALISNKQKECCSSKHGGQKIFDLFKQNEYCCGEHKYNNVTHWCLKTHDTDYVLPYMIDMCGETKYNITTQVCCYDTGTVRNTSGNGFWMCKNGQVYDSKKSYFDEEAKKIVTIGHLLCNLSVEFDPANKKCCTDRLYTLAGNKECCGSSYYDTISHGCCGGKVYDETKEACCNFQIMTISSELECCGSGIINKTTDVCCKTHFTQAPILKKKFNDTTCCPYGKNPEPYNEFSEECKRYVGVCKKSNEIPTVGPTALPTRGTPPKISRNPFCKGGKKEQMIKSCEKRNALNVFVLGSITHRRKTTLTALIFFPKRYRGLKAEFNIAVRAKCVEKWMMRSIWLFTNRRPKRDKRMGTLHFKVTGNDLLMRDTRRNRLMKTRICQRILS